MRFIRIVYFYYYKSTLCTTRTWTLLEYGDEFWTGHHVSSTAGVLLMCVHASMPSTGWSGIWLHKKYETLFTQRSVEVSLSLSSLSLWPTVYLRYRAHILQWLFYRTLDLSSTKLAPAPTGENSPLNYCPCTLFRKTDYSKCNIVLEVTACYPLWFFHSSINKKSLMPPSLSK